MQTTGDRPPGPIGPDAHSLQFSQTPCLKRSCTLCTDGQNATVHLLATPALLVISCSSTLVAGCPGVFPHHHHHHTSFVRSIPFSIRAPRLATSLFDQPFLFYISRFSSHSPWACLSLDAPGSCHIFSHHSLYHSTNLEFHTAPSPCAPLSPPLLA